MELADDARMHPNAGFGDRLYSWAAADGTPEITARR